MAQAYDQKGMLPIHVLALNYNQLNRNPNVRRDTVCGSRTASSILMLFFFQHRHNDHFSEFSFQFLKILLEELGSDPFALRYVKKSENATKWKQEEESCEENRSRFYQLSGPFRPRNPREKTLSNSIQGKLVISSSVCYIQHVNMTLMFPCHRHGTKFFLHH